MLQRALRSKRSTNETKFPSISQAYCCTYALTSTLSLNERAYYTCRDRE